MVKFIDSKVIQFPERRKQGVYQVVLELTDKDMNSLEDLAISYCVNGVIEKDGIAQYDTSHEFKDEYNSFCKKLFHEARNVWHMYYVLSKAPKLPKKLGKVFGKAQVRKDQKTMDAACARYREYLKEYDRKHPQTERQKKREKETNKMLDAFHKSLAPLYKDFKTFFIYKRSIFDLPETIKVCERKTELNPFKMEKLLYQINKTKIDNELWWVLQEPWVFRLFGKRVSSGWNTLGQSPKLDECVLWLLQGYAIEKAVS